MCRLLLGKQSIGESRDFYLHTGLMGHNNRLVKILECPPRRQELLEQYSERLREAVRGFSSPVTCVLVVIKQAIMSGAGFALNRERNIPLDELRAAYSVMGNRFKTSIHVVFTNWSRQFARLNDRLKRGITEETAQNKIATEFQRNLNISIFLRQFRSSNEDIIEMVVNGDFSDFEPEKLKGLMKILPEQDEVIF